MAQLNTTLSIVDKLKSMGKPSDYGSRSNLYKTLGLESKYGSYLGSGQQNTAMINLLSAQKSQQFKVPGTLSELPGYVPQPGNLSSYQPSSQASVQPIQQPVQQSKTEQASISTEAGIKEQLATAEKALQASQGILKQAQDLGYTGGQEIRLDSTTGKVLPPTTAPTGTTGTTGTQGNVQAPMGTTDLVSIIDKITSGEIEMPEIALAKEATELAKESEKMRAAQALESTQQMLATRGMAFSSIRSSAEANLAAEHLANMSGISMKLAAEIISAARQEQTRTKPTYTTLGGALYEILPGQEPRKIIEAEPKIESMTYEGQRWERDPITGDWKMAFEIPEKAPSLASVKSNIVVDVNRAVDQYKLNPEGFRERYIESLVATYGEEQRKYITDQVYALMPDVVKGQEIETMSKWQLEMAVNQLLALPSSEGGYADKPVEEQMQMIRKSGFNPLDFGIY